MTFQAKLLFIFAASAVEHDWVLHGYYVLIGLGIVTITDTKHNYIDLCQQIQR